MTAKEGLNQYIAKLGFSYEIQKELKNHINKFALHIVEQAVEEEKIKLSTEEAFGAIKILSRIKTLTEE